MNNAQALITTVTIQLAVVRYAVIPAAAAESKLRKKLDQQEPDYPVEEYLENCGMTHKLVTGDKKAFKVATPYYGRFQYPPSMQCSWSFIGSEDCQASVTCSEVDLRPNPDCEEEFLEITDGFGGEQKICGTGVRVSGVKAHDGNKDLYMRLKTMDSPVFDRRYRGVFCEVRCNSGSTELQESLTAYKENTCVCGGVRNSKDRIVGGLDAEKNEFPWQAAIVTAGTRRPKCGGSVINDRWILTAAHCFTLERSSPNLYDVLLHAHALDITPSIGHSDISGGPQADAKFDGEYGIWRYKIEEILTHPLFSSRFDYDVALLKTTRKIDLGGAVVPVCLPLPSQYGMDYSGKIATVAGWGKAHQFASGTSRILQKLDVPILNVSVCHKLMPQKLTPRMFCAGFVEGGKDACQGDSGGPLVLKNMTTGQWMQVGIVSWGEGCAQYHRPGLYSKVTDLNQWITKHASSGTWCRRSINWV